MSPWFAVGALAAIIWALASFGSWVADGAQPPAGLSTFDSQRIYFTLARSRGPEPYVGEHGRSLIKQARILRRNGLPPHDVNKLEKATIDWGQGLVPGQRLILYRAVNDALFPGGRPKTDGKLRP